MFSSRSALGAALLVLLGIAVVYGPSVAGCGWVADDVGLIARHAHPGDVLGEWTRPTHELATGVRGGVVWRPLIGTLYQLISEVFGREPKIFKVVNILIHMMSALTLAGCARRLGAGAWGAALLALGWAVHPSTADTVAWISDTCDGGAALFTLGAFWALLEEGPALARRSAVAAGLFLAALLCKETAVVFAVALPLALLLLRGRRPAVVAAGALGGVALAHGLWHAAVVGRADPGARALLDPLWVAIWTDYLSTPLRPVADGFLRLVWRAEPPWSVLGVGVLVGLVGVGVALRTGAAESSRALGASAILWGLGLVPAAAVAVTTGMNPARYAVLPAALLFAALGGVRWRAGALVGALWVLAWAPTGWMRAAEWRTEWSLYSAEAAAAPDNPLAARNLGRLLVERGATDEGLELWAQALARPPESRYAMDPQRERLDLAVTAAGLGRTALARRSLDAFLAEERAAGRPIDPSIVALSVRLDPRGGLDTPSGTPSP